MSEFRADQPFPTRRELREREAAAAASAPELPRAELPTLTQSIPVIMPQIAHDEPSEGRVYAVTVPSKRRPRAMRSPKTGPRPTVVRQRRSAKKMLRGLVTIGAMLGAGALLVSTSLPASALHGAAAQAAETSVSAPAAPTQELALSKSALAPAAATRDGYTVVTLAAQIKAKYGNQSFLYTNDPNGTIQWPFPIPSPISSGYGPRIAPCGGCSSFHQGVDFTPGAGTPIQVIADGTVSLVDTTGALGWHVIVDHVINGQKVQSVYGHMLAGSIKVVVGQQLKVKDIIGQVGSTGESTGAHLHLEIHLDGTPVDPFAWLKANAN